jgi:hypothetical protein
MSGGSALYHAKIDATSDGAQVLVTGRARQKIRVVGITMTADTTGQVTFNAEDDSDYVVLDPSANGGFSEHGSIQNPLFDCATGDDLEVTTSASQDVSGRISYAFINTR